jgi:prepilin-type processing-associated H-X9-DG protein
VKGLEPLSRQRRVFVWTTILVAGTAWSVVFTAIALKASSDQARDTACYANVKALSWGMLLYAQDNDGVLPPADRWVEVSPAFTKYRRPEACGCPSLREGGFGYAMSGALSSRDVAAVREPAKAALVFDSILPGLNASGDLSTLPRPPRHGARGPLDRTPPYNNLAYADGHVGRVQGLR